MRLFIAALHKSRSSLQALASSQASTSGRCPGAVATRSVATQYAQELIKYNRDRADWKREMTKLRKQWLAEQQTQAAATAGVQAAKEAEEAKLRAARREARQLEKERARRIREIEDAEFALEVAEAKLAKAKRQTLREQILEEEMQKRRQLLLDQSKNWIDKHQLLDRINAALDSPSSLGRLPDTGYQEGP